MVALAAAAAAHSSTLSVAGIDVSLEIASKRVFASALEWPGWARSGRDEATALAQLEAYAERYRLVASTAGLKWPSRIELSVAERLPGSASTQFGVLSEIAAYDRQAPGKKEIDRLEALLRAGWQIFDNVVASAPPTLRKGPRGGGRDRDKIVDHVLGAESTGYLRKLGTRLAQPARDDPAAIEAERQAVLVAVRKRASVADAQGWPVRYAVRRIMWHVLDHAWEIEDRGDGG